MNSVINIGSAALWRGVYNDRATYYNKNLVTMCSCIFRCDVDRQSGVPPCVIDDEEAETYKLANENVWTCVLNNLELHNRMKRAIDAIDRADTIIDDYDASKEALQHEIAYLQELLENLPYVGEDLYIYEYDIDTHEYKKTDIMLGLDWNDMTQEQKEELADSIPIEAIGRAEIEDIIGKVIDYDPHGEWPDTCRCKDKCKNWSPKDEPPEGAEELLTSDGVAIYGSDNRQIFTRDFDNTEIN